MSSLSCGHTWGRRGEQDFLIALFLLQFGFYLRGIHLRRDSLSSIAYSEELIFSVISATLQSTDRHHGIVGQERSHFQRDS